MSVRYTLSASDLQQQAFQYVVNRLLEFIDRDHKKIFAFSTSNSYKAQKDNITKALAELSQQKGKRVLYVQCDQLSSGTDSIMLNTEQGVDVLQEPTVETLKLFLHENRSLYDMIILNLSPILYAAQASEYAKLSDGVFLLERYVYSQYSNYENTLLALKQQSISILGVIPYE